VLSSFTSSSYLSSITILSSDCVQTFIEVRSKYVSEGPAQFEIEYMWSAVCVYTGESSWNPFANTLVCDQSQHIIAQHYSSVIRLNAIFMQATSLCLLLYKPHLFGLPQHVFILIQFVSLTCVPYVLTYN